MTVTSLPDWKVDVSRFEIKETPLPGLSVIRRLYVSDARGSLSRFYCHEEFASIGLNRPIAQINHTQTFGAGTVRGMHFQHPPHAEAKLVSCLRGKIFDVAVDLRRGSATFLQWYGEELSADNHRSLLIPEGFAHGFQLLTDDCEMIYLHTAAYCKVAEGALNPADPRLAIGWPLPVANLSERDETQPFLDRNFQGIDL